MSSDDYILGPFKSFTCAYCGEEIPNDLDFIKYEHSGQCTVKYANEIRFPSAWETAKRVMADEEKRTGIKIKLLKEEK